MPYDWLDWTGETLGDMTMSDPADLDLIDGATDVAELWMSDRVVSSGQRMMMGIG